MCLHFICNPSSQARCRTSIHGIISTIRKLHTFRRGVFNPCQLKRFYKWEKWEFRTEANFFKITQLTMAEVRILTPAVWLHRLQSWYSLNCFLLSSVLTKVCCSMLLEIFPFLSFFLSCSSFVVWLPCSGSYVICLGPGMLKYLWETKAMCSAGISTNNTLLCISS